MESNVMALPEGFVIDDDERSSLPEGFVIDSGESNHQQQEGGGFFGASVVEPLATFASGMIAEPAAGIAGLATGLLAQDRAAAAAVTEGVRDRLTYSPKTEKGRQGLEYVATSAPIQALGKGLQAVEQFTGDAGYAVGGPVGGAIGATLPTAAMELLGLKGASKARGARKISGIPDDIIDDLAKRGVDIDDLSDQGVQKVMQSVANRTDEEIKRLKAFELENIPTTQSRVSQRFGDFLNERTIARADTPQGKAVRSRLADESAGFQDAVTRYKNSFGLSDDAGESIKEALKARVSGIRDDATNAYKKLDELTQGKSLPLVGDKITEALDDPKIQAFAGRLSPSERSALNDVFIEFGLDSDADRAADWVARRQGQSGILAAKSDVTPLSISNFEDMRQAVSGLGGPDASAEMRGIAGRLKAAIDSEVDSLDVGSLSNSSETVAAAKRARELWGELKGAQNTDTLLGRLVSGKKRTPDEDILLASEITKRITSDAKDGAIENISKVMDALEKSPNGKKAIGDLQADIAAKLLNKSISKTPLEGGVKGWIPGQYTSEFDRLAKNGRLDRIFKDNPEGLAGLKRIRDLGESTKAPAEVARFSGTADDVINALGRSDTFKRLSQFMGFAGGGVVGGVAADVAGGAVDALKGRKATKAAQQALKVSPNDYAKMMQVKRLYPELYTVLVPVSAAQTAKQQTQETP